MALLLKSWRFLSLNHNCSWDGRSIENNALKVQERGQFELFGRNSFLADLLSSHQAGFEIGSLMPNPKIPFDHHGCQQIILTVPL